ncbi:hypothetical protein BASA62_001981 [Batrachochytrium salamandrivorans]|nr:hypothetical protein BASA62_001981 [Batrachochytrium salamandrivorans]
MHSQLHQLQQQQLLSQQQQPLSQQQHHQLQHPLFSQGLSTTRGLYSELGPLINDFDFSSQNHQQNHHQQNHHHQNHHQQNHHQQSHQQLQHARYQDISAIPSITTISPKSSVSPRSGQQRNSHSDVSFNLLGTGWVPPHTSLTDCHSDTTNPNITTNMHSPSSRSGFDSLMRPTSIVTTLSPSSSPVVMSSLHPPLDRSQISGTLTIPDIPTITPPSPRFGEPELLMVPSRSNSSGGYSSQRRRRRSTSSATGSTSLSRDLSPQRSYFSQPSTSVSVSTAIGIPSPSLCSSPCGDLSPSSTSVSIPSVLISSADSNISSNLAIINPSQPALSPSSSTHSTSQPKERPFACTFPNCSATFTRMYNLKSHLLTHTKEKPHACPFLCGVSFGRRHDLQRHLRTLHSPDRPFQCPFESCGYAFRRMNAFQKHLMEMHPENPDGSAGDHRGGHAAILQNAMDQISAASASNALNDSSGGADTNNNSSHNKNNHSSSHEVKLTSPHPSTLAYSRPAPSVAVAGGDQAAAASSSASGSDMPSNMLGAFFGTLNSSGHSAHSSGDGSLPRRMNSEDTLQLPVGHGTFLPMHSPTQLLHSTQPNRGHQQGQPTMLPHHSLLTPFGVGDAGGATSNTGYLYAPTSAPPQHHTQTQGVHPSSNDGLHSLLAGSAIDSGPVSQWTLLAQQQQQQQLQMHNQQLQQQKQTDVTTAASGVFGNSIQGNMGIHQ